MKMKKNSRKDKKTLALRSVVGGMAILALMAGMTGAIALGTGQGDAQGDFVPGEVIVGFKEEAGISAQESVISAYGGNVVDRIDALNCVLVKVKSGDEQVFIRDILEEPNVRYAEPNGIVKALYVPNDPRYGEQWGPEKINAADAWDIEKGDKNVIIAIIDTGIDYNHEDLSGNYVSGGYDWVNDDDDPWDDSVGKYHGHGTHCAGIAGAVMDNGKGIAGIAQVEIMAEKVMNETGYGTYFNASRGITGATDKGANIISMSFGGGSPSSTLEKACNHAWNRECLLVAAAGNDNSDEISYPARYDTVIAVGAINEDGDKWWRSNYGDDVELVAPGDHILSTVPEDNYASKSGTSMATPHVAGVAALVWSMYPDLTNEEVRERLHKTGVYYEWDGHGLVDAVKPLQVEEEYVKISSVNVGEGEVAETQISIGNAKNIVGVSLILKYNESVVAIQNIIANETIPNCTCYSDITESGIARIIFLSEDPINTTSETPIIDVELEAIGSAGSFSYLNLSSVNFTDITSYLPYAPADVFNGTVNVPVPKPDLTVTSISINPGGTRGEDIVRVYVNESNNICAVVYNNGTDDAGTFDVCFDADGVKIGCVEVASLAAGANTTVSIDWTPTCANYAVMPGFPAQSLPVTINVSADCNEEIAESDEQNNKLSKFIPAIQVYSTYNVIGGVVNNGYKSKNFDCNTTEEPLTLFEYDTEIVGGGIEYNVSGEKISAFAPGDTSARIHHIELPDGATVKKARLYVYWYDKWGNYKTYPTGCLADLRVNFSGTEFMPGEKYNDQKGFGYYQSPKGTYVYDITSKITESGDYTAIVENIDPANSTTLLGEMLFVAYGDPTKTDKIQLWVLEGNDYLMAADETHGGYNYGVSPEEATATVAFPGSIADLANVSSATLVTVVAQGRTTGMDMLFNGNVVKKDAWDSPTEAYPNSKICMESVNVKANLTSSGNNMGFLDNGTDGMQASNAILVVEYKKEVEFEIPLRTGWNLISLPLSPANTSILSVMSSIGDENWTSVWSYDETGWHRYDKEGPPFLNDLNTMDAGSGYWINMIADDTLVITGSLPEPTDITLRESWNLVGYNSMESMATLIALASLGNNWTSVWTYDETGWHRYDKEGPPFLNDLTEMGPSNGYWINMIVPDVWSI